MRSLRAPVGLVALAIVQMGCLGFPMEFPTGSPDPGAETAITPSPTETPTPLPSGTIDFPEGPKDPPERPTVLNDTTVATYVESYEYRYVYNQLWVNTYTVVSLQCRVDYVEKRPWGYESVVTCTGYSETSPPSNVNATPAPHFDYFTQSFQYRVSDVTTHRMETANRGPVS